MPFEIVNFNIQKSRSALAACYDAIKATVTIAINSHCCPQKQPVAIRNRVNQQKKELTVSVRFYKRKDLSKQKAFSFLK